jgi:hypothetical protein
MKKMLLAVFCVSLVCSFASADAAINHNGKFGLYLAGPTPDCDYVMTDCFAGATHLYTGQTNPSALFDLYLVAVDVQGIAGARYGYTCEILSGGFFFYGFNSCSDFEIPEAGFPSCGTGNAQTWVGEQAGPHVTMGIQAMYVYAGTNARLCVGPDPRVGFAEFCDGTEPAPLCNTVASGGWGCFGVNRLGYNPCDRVPVEQKSWGAVKSLYR